MGNIIQDLKRFSDRLIKPELIVPYANSVKKPTFKVMVAVCTHRDVKVQIFKVLRLIEACPDPQIRVATEIGDALIDRSRSVAATKFLLDFDDDILFFLDDDIVTNTKNLTMMMWEMQKLDLDVLAAAYPLKTFDNPTFAVRTLDDHVNFTVGKGAEIQEMRYVSTGCMGIKRKVFQKMVEKEIVHLCHPQTQRFYPFFCPMEHQYNGTWLYLSEDWAFCQRARDLGFKVWCDFNVKLGHLGSYEYTWEDFFRQKKIPMEGFNYNVDVQKE